MKDHIKLPGIAIIFLALLLAPNLITEGDPKSTGEPIKTAAESQQPDSGPEDEEWYDRYVSAAKSMQELPEHVPFLAGKGWLHFGRIEGEYAEFSEGILKDSSGFNFRSLRGGFIRVFNKRTTVKLEIDLTDGDSNWTDLYGRYKTWFGYLTVGNQKIAQTLVNQTSRLSRTFMEEPLPSDAFGLGRRLGAGWDFHLNKVGTHLTVFSKDLNNNIGKLGYGYRLYFNPTKSRSKIIHLGVSAVQEKMDRDAQFRAYPESRVTDIRLVDTGRHSDVDTQTIFGLELAGARDSFSVRGEYMIAEWDRENGRDPRFDGYYVQANWAVTGEVFRYTQGKFQRLRPIGSGVLGRSPFDIRGSTLTIWMSREEKKAISVWPSIGIVPATS